MNMTHKTVYLFPKSRCLRPLLIDVATAKVNHIPDWRGYHIASRSRNHLSQDIGTTGTRSRQIQCSAVITRSIFSKYSQRTPHSSPARARYGVSFVDPRSGWHSDAFLVINHVISYNIRPRYNGTPLYMGHIHRFAQCSVNCWQLWASRCGTADGFREMC